MKKGTKAVIFLAIGSFSSVVYAGDFSTLWHDNWLLGVSAGYATRKSTIQASVQPVTNFLGYGKDVNDDGWLTAIFVGYQAVHERWLLGGEFNLEWENIERSHHYNFSERNVSTDYRRKGVLDFSGRLGFALAENWMPYLRVGVELSRDSLSSYFVGTTRSVSLFNKAWIHRFILGAGAEMPIPGVCGLTVRLEYDYHSKGKTIQDFGATGEGLTLIQYYTAMQPRTYSGRVSVVWNFFP